MCGRGQWRELTDHRCLPWVQRGGWQPCPPPALERLCCTDLEPRRRVPRGAGTGPRPCRLCAEQIKRIGTVPRGGWAQAPGGTQVSPSSCPPRSAPATRGAALPSPCATRDTVTNVPPTSSSLSFPPASRAAPLPAFLPCSARPGLRPPVTPRDLPPPRCSSRQASRRRQGVHCTPIASPATANSAQHLQVQSWSRSNPNPLPAKPPEPVGDMTAQPDATEEPSPPPQVTPAPPSPPLQEPLLLPTCLPAPRNSP